MEVSEWLYYFACAKCGEYHEGYQVQHLNLHGADGPWADGPWADGPWADGP